MTPKLTLKRTCNQTQVLFYCSEFSSIILSRIHHSKGVSDIYKEELYMFENSSHELTEQDKLFPLCNDGIEENDDDYEFEEYNCD